MSQNSSGLGEVHIQKAAHDNDDLLNAGTIQNKHASSLIDGGLDDSIRDEKITVCDKEDDLEEDYDMERSNSRELDDQSNIHDENIASETSSEGTPRAPKFEMDSMNMYNNKEKLKCTPAIQKLRKGLAEFDVRSPSDAMMSPVTAKLSQVRHTMKQSDAIRHGRGGGDARKNPSPQRLIFEDDE
uniref:Uncharacterized protein n=1 Tax=Panagrolaimus sp. ES5 TaxID=591445 RepID=A0AC34GQU0_9BILA